IKRLKRQTICPISPRRRLARIHNSGSGPPRPLLQLGIFPPAPHPSSPAWEIAAAAVVSRGRPPLLPSSPVLEIAAAAVVSRQSCFASVSVGMVF
ncbi:hypothetical protein U9M48_023579, partial [Paspalum notatum var. saurae]